MGKAQQIVGYSDTREKDDFYATPEASTKQLLAKEGFVGGIYEPCCGQGHIATVLEDAGYEVEASDLIYRGYGTPRIDFLMERTRRDNIVTNPPYKNALDFAEQAITLSKRKVALLLKLSFLEGVARHKFFQQHPPKTVWVFSQRQSLMKNGTPYSGGMMALAWFVWEQGNNEQPRIGWI
jgi:hypothetical protein